MPRNLTSLTALITGSGAGLGLTIAHRLASHGVKICFNDLPIHTSLLSSHRAFFTSKYTIITTSIAAGFVHPAFAMMISTPPRVLMVCSTAAVQPPGVEMSAAMEVVMMVYFEVKKALGGEVIRTCTNRE